MLATTQDLIVARLIASAPIGIAILDLDMRFIVVNEPLAKINGVAVSEHAGKHVAEIVPMLYERVRSMFEAAIQAGSEPVHFELAGETAAHPGITRYWKETWFQIRTEHGLRAIGVFVDEVTDEKRNLEELHRAREAERRHAEEIRAIMEATPAAILIAEDRDCTRITGNRESYVVLEMADGNASASGPEEEVRRRKFREYRDGKPLPPDELPMQRAARTGEPVRGADLSLVFDDGHVRHIHGNAAPLHDTNGEVRGAVAAFIDITERKEAEEALRRTDQRKNEFIATLAHELRNPLSPIRNAAEVLRIAPDNKVAQAKSVDIIERQVQHMTRLLDDLLDVARITNNQMSMRKQPIRLREPVDDAVEAAQPLINTRRHRLTVVIAEEPLTVMGDSVRLTQIFVNLLTNAAKYTPEEGLITVTIAREGNEALIQVSDNGVGFAADQTHNLFQPFHRVHSSADAMAGGLGIGLSLVKLLAKAHGGAVSASSRGLGQGSVFTVRLPIHEAQISP